MHCHVVRPETAFLLVRTGEMRDQGQEERTRTVHAFKRVDEIGAGELNHRIASCRNLPLGTYVQQTARHVYDVA